MKDLIEALTIFLKYRDSRNPTHCEHDVLTITHVTLDEVSDADRRRLEELGFFWDDSEDGSWQSFRYGSA
jgi:hypothetical protein